MVLGPKTMQYEKPMGYSTVEFQFSDPRITDLYVECSSKWAASALSEAIKANETGEAGREISWVGLGIRSDDPNDPDRNSESTIDLSYVAPLNMGAEEQITIVATRNFATWLKESGMTSTTIDRALAKTVPLGAGATNSEIPKKDVTEIARQTVDTIFLNS